VDLKYITPSLVLDVPYEGRTRRFLFYAATSPAESEGEGLATKLSSFSLGDSIKDGRICIWSVGWNTQVILDTLEAQANNIPEPAGKVRRAIILLYLATNLRQQEVIESMPGDVSPKDAYASVGGLDTQVQQVRDLLEIPLTRPDLFRHYGTHILSSSCIVTDSRVGLKPPRGILLHGPPGTGKTHLARAIAASTNASVLIISGPELSGAYHGETESRLRAVFEEAKAKVRSHSQISSSCQRNMITIVEPMYSYS
jgi:AAA family ATPase